MKAVDNPVSESNADALGTFWTLTPQAVLATLHCGLDGFSRATPNRGLLNMDPTAMPRPRPTVCCAPSFVDCSSRSL